MFTHRCHAGKTIMVLFKCVEEADRLLQLRGVYAASRFR